MNAGWLSTGLTHVWHAVNDARLRIGGSQESKPSGLRHKVDLVLYKLSRIPVRPGFVFLSSTK